GAEAILKLQGSLEEIIRQNRLGDVAGIGDTLREKITTLVQTGRLPFYDELKSKIPPGLPLMLRIPGLGPKKVKALNDELGFATLNELKQACDQGKVASLKGFGTKTQKKILDGLQFLGEIGIRVRIDQALPIGLSLLEQVRKMPDVIRAELGGSIRR